MGYRTQGQRRMRRGTYWEYDREEQERGRGTDGEPASTWALVCAVLGLLVLWPLIIVAMILAAPHRRYNRNAELAWTICIVGLALLAGAIVLCIVIVAAVAS